MIGATEATNWRKRLDEYIAQVSVVVKAVGVFVGQLMTVFLLMLL